MFAKCFGVEIASNDKRDRKLTRVLINQTQFCEVFVALWSQNRVVKHRPNCPFLNWSSFPSSPTVWSWILGDDGESVISSATVRNWIFAQLRNSQIPECLATRPPNREISAVRRFGYVTKMPQEDCQGESCLLPQRAICPDVNQEPGDMITFVTLLA